MTRLALPQRLLSRGVNAVFGRIYPHPLAISTPARLRANSFALWCVDLRRILFHLLPLVGDEGFLTADRRLELLGPAFAAQIVANPQRFTVQLVDGQEHHAVDESTIQLLRLRRRVQLEGPLFDGLLFDGPVVGF